MPFVEAGYNRGSQDGDGRPARRPFSVVHCGQSGAPGAEEQDAEDGVADDVASLANVEVPVIKSLPVHAEKKMQQGVENSAGVPGRQQGGGFDGDDDQPEDGSDPGLQKIALVGVQALRLLDAIIGSLAGNHYIVDMALAESSAADAHEARFLQ